MNLDLITKALIEHLDEKGLHLYELKYSKGDSILHVCLDDSLDMNQVEEASRDISDFMDKFEDQFDEYLLDVYTIGIERPIRNKEELIQAVGSYIFVKGKDFKLSGTLSSFVDDILTLSYKEKNITKTMTINYQSIKEMRYAVEI